MHAFSRSVGHAWRGLGQVLVRERNARIHLLAAILVIGVGVLLQITSTDLAAITFAIILVFVAEILNTAIEKTLDLVEPGHNPEVGLVKDMAAGGVLVAAVGALVIGVVVFWPYVIGALWPAR